MTLLRKIENVKLKPKFEITFSKEKTREKSVKIHHEGTSFYGLIHPLT